MSVDHEDTGAQDVLVAMVRLPERELLDAMGFVRLLSVDPGAGRVRAEFDAQSRFCHTNGTTVQGGFITAWLDFTMAQAAILHAGRDAGIASLEIKVSFLQRVGQGRVIGDGRIARIGRRVAFLEASLESPADGTVLATASSSALILRG